MDSYHNAKKQFELGATLKAKHQDILERVESGLVNQLKTSLHGVEVKERVVEPKNLIILEE